MKMMPGIGKMAKQIEAAGIDDSVFKRQQAIISSMTKKERKTPKLLNASRKKRVAKGSGSTVQEINQLMKMHRQMADMMKSMTGKKGGKRGMMGQMASMMGLGQGMGGAGGMPQLPPGMGAGGGMPDVSGMDPKQLEEMARRMGGPGGVPKLPGLGGGLPGFGRKK